MYALVHLANGQVSSESQEASNLRWTRVEKFTPDSWNGSSFFTNISRRYAKGFEQLEQAF